MVKIKSIIEKCTSKSSGNRGESSKEINKDMDELFGNYYIPNTYRDMVLKHLILNYASNINGFSPPLILAIQGYKGEGKSFMLNLLCDYYNIELRAFSGTDLCGPNEGDSIIKLKKEYELCCALSRQDKKFRAILIDDFHMSIGGDFSNEVSRTTNAQGLIGYLMNLCDDPFIDGVRIPIIVTGNDFTKTYSALTRNGRMSFLEWKPNTEEKKRIVYYMYKCFFCDIKKEDTDTLVEKYEHKYIAFFKDVLQQLFFDGFDNVFAQFHRNKNSINCDNINTLIKQFLQVKDFEISRCLNIAKKVDVNLPSNYER